MQLLSYTHWAYFNDHESALACGAELDRRFDCLSAIDRARSVPKWLLKAARPVDTDVDFHTEIGDVVDAYGGTYDGGIEGDRIDASQLPAPRRAPGAGLDPDREYVEQRLDSLQQELGSNYMPPSEIVDAIANPAANDEPDPTVVLGAAATVRLLAEYLRGAVAAEFALYSPQQAAGAVQDMAIAIWDLAAAMDGVTEPVKAAHDRGDIPDVHPGRIEVIARFLNGVPDDVTLAVGAGATAAEDYRALPYSGYVGRGEMEHLHSIAAELKAADQRVQIGETSPSGDNALACIEFTFDGWRCFLVDGLGWEVRFEDESLEPVPAYWPTGSVVHPRPIAQGALAAVLKILYGGNGEGAVAGNRTSDHDLMGE